MTNSRVPHDNILSTRHTTILYSCCYYGISLASFQILCTINGVCVCTCLCIVMRVWIHVCMRACVRACVRACMCMLCVCMKCTCVRGVHAHTAYKMHHPFSSLEKDITRWMHGIMGWAWARQSGGQSHPAHRKWIVTEVLVRTLGCSLRLTRCPTFGTAVDWGRRTGF